MKQIKITGENRKAKLKEFLSHFYSDDLDKYTEVQLIEMYDKLGYYKISKNNFDIICMRNNVIKEIDMWTKDQQKYLNDMENNLHQKIDNVKTELNQKIDDIKTDIKEMNVKLDKIFKRLGID